MPTEQEQQKQEETAFMDFFECVSSEEYKGEPVKILVSAQTTANYKTVIEQAQEEDFRIMTERELNRRLEKAQAHFRVGYLKWCYSNEKAPKESDVLTIEASIRPVGVEDL